MYKVISECRKFQKKKIQGLMLLSFKNKSDLKR